MSGDSLTATNLYAEMPEKNIQRIVKKTGITRSAYNGFQNNRQLYYLQQCYVKRRSNACTSFRNRTDRDRCAQLFYRAVPPLSEAFSESPLPFG